jgi:hypothetical protein
MKKLLLAIGLITAFTATGCGPVQPIVTDVVDCAKAEATVVSDGFSIVQITMEVIAAIQGGPSAVLQAVEDLVKKYGGDVVACVIDNFPEPKLIAATAAGSGSPATVTATAASQAVLNKRLVMATLFAGKKISHAAFKKH